MQSGHATECESKERSTMRISSICRFLCCAAFAALSCVPAAAQPKTIYYGSACVKVKPGREADFASQMNDNMLKVEQARLDAGTITGWLALRAVLPMGKKAKCDYLIVTFYPGLPKGILNNEDTTVALEKAGMSMTADEFWESIREDSYLVSNDVGEMPVMLGGGQKGYYDVVNYMNMPNTEQCVNTEKTLWHPFAEARMKAGQQSGWGVWLTMFPRGSQVEQSAGTVDIYPTWDAIFMEGFQKTWQDVHPDVKVEDAMEQFDKQCSIRMSVIYEEVEDIHAPVQ
jgi:hypothetical protein